MGSRQTSIDSDSTVWCLKHPSLHVRLRNVAEENSLAEGDTIRRLLGEAVNHCGKAPLLRRLRTYQVLKLLERKSEGLVIKDLNDIEWGPIGTDPVAERVEVFLLNSETQGNCGPFDLPEGVC